MAAALKSLHSYYDFGRAYWARQREQWYAAPALRALRVRRLKKLIEVADTTPYYREVLAKAGLSPGDVTSEAVLEALPVLDKRDVRERSPEMLTQHADVLGSVTTSGSTGQPLRILRSARDQAQVSAVWMRVQRAYGRRFRHKQANIGSGRSVARKGPVLSLQKLGLVPKTYQLSSFDPVDEQISLLREVKPEVISGYAVALEILADGIVERGVQDIRPLMVLSGGMELSERGRSVVEQAFGRRVLDNYAANEVGCIAWECPVTPGVLHLNDDVQIVELLDEDGHPVRDGEVGEVVVTQLNCTALPLIRYRIGDLTSFQASRCSCGRHLRTIGKVQGRLATTLRSRDGRVLNNVVLSAILGPYQQIKRYQVKQVSPDDLLISVVPAKSWTPDIGEAVLRDLRSRLGDHFRYQLVLCDDIPLTAQGKFHVIVPLAEGGA